MATASVQLQSIEKKVTKHFGLTSIEAEQVIITLQKVLKAKAKNDEMRRRLISLELSLVKELGLSSREAYRINRAFQEVLCDRAMNPLAVEAKEVRQYHA